MSLELRMKYCETVYRRYRKASKESKARILDEFCQVCGYNRKYAIWKLILFLTAENQVMGNSFIRVILSISYPSG